MAFDSNAFIAEIVKDAQLDDATKTALLKVATDPAVAPKLQNLYENGLRQDEFSRKMNEYDSKLKTVTNYQGQLTDWKVKYEKEVEQKFQEELGRVKRQLNGQGLYDGGADPNEGKIDAGEIQKQIESMKTQQEEYNRNMFLYQNSLTKIGLQHMKEFGGALDVDALVAFANERGKNILDAYESFVQPQRQEVQQKAFQVQLEQARKEGAAEAMKNAKLPTVMPSTFNNGIPHPSDGLKGNTDGKFGAMAAVKAFMENAVTK